MNGQEFFFFFFFFGEKKGGRKIGTDNEKVSCVCLSTMFPVWNLRTVYYTCPVSESYVALQKSTRRNKGSTCSHETCFKSQTKWQRSFGTDYM